MKRHIELPHIIDMDGLKPQDVLVYLGIKSFMNKETMEAFPSQKSISEIIGCCDKTIRKCVKNLIDKDYIKIRKEGKKIIYCFNLLKQFEPFFYEFLKDKNLSFTEKAFLACSQQYMKDKETGICRIDYSKMELAKLINMPYPTVVKVYRDLANKEIISPEGKFYLNKYHQQIVKVLLNHESRIESNEDDISELKDKIRILTEKINKLEGKEDYIII